MDNKTKPTTILIDQPIGEDIEHPLFYFQNRNHLLQTLSQKYSTENRLPTMDLKRNPRIDYYVSAYEKKMSHIKKVESKKKSYLSSDEFVPIFAQEAEQTRQQLRERREMEKLKEDLEKMYLRNEQVHQEPQKDDEAQEQPQTILMGYGSDPTRQKEMYLLDLEIGKMTFEKKLPHIVETKLASCNNPDLLMRMSNSVLSSFMLHFEEIFSSLIDQILGEEVAYLNYIEAEYQIENRERTDYSNQYENMKAIQMMELVKGLDQLADD